MKNIKRWTDAKLDKELAMARGSVGDDPNAKAWLDKLETEAHRRNPEGLPFALRRFEPGAASIKVELSGGHIAVYHGTDGTLLAELRDAPFGTWGRMWTGLEGLGIKRRYK